MVVGNRSKMLLIVSMFVAAAFAVGVSVTGDTGSRDFVTHDPITIAGDADFTAVNGVVEGAGTEGDPYEITGWTITASSGNAITISDTTKFVTIEFSHIKDVGGSNYGISITNAANVDIQHNVFEGNANAIYLKTVNDVQVDYNTFIDNARGVIMDDVTNADVDYNTFSGSTTSITMKGSEITKSKDNNIDYNTIIGGDVGVMVKRSKSFNIDYNMISGATTAVSIEEISSSDIDYNCMCGGTTGVDAKSTESLNIDYNCFRDFTSYAIVSMTSATNNINNNVFKNNGGSGKQAKATAVTADDWDNNYWSDHSTTDPYAIDGGEINDEEPVLSEPVGSCAGVGPVTAVAYADVTAGNLPHEVHFVGGAAGGLAPYTYSWAFGDGEVGTGQTVTHTYATAGTFSAVLTVVDAASTSKAATAIPIVVLTAVDPLSVTITSNINTGHAPMSVQLNATVTGGEAPYTYSWDFGDLKTGTGASATHLYDTMGAYNVTVTVKDKRGTEVTASAISLTVKEAIPPLITTFVPDKMTGKAPLKVTFASTVVGGSGTYTYIWDFGDGTNSTEANPVHTFKKKDTYTVKMTVTDDLGNTEFFSVPIDVKKKEEQQPGFELAFMIIAVALVFVATSGRKK